MVMASQVQKVSAAGVVNASLSRRAPSLRPARPQVLPFSVARVRRTIARGVYASNVVSDVGKYLSEAAAAIFSPIKSDVDFPTSDFSGRIIHHEELPRLRKLYDVVKQTRENITGCMDPEATNYDPKAIVDSGTCTYVEDGEKALLSDDLKSYITSTLSKVFDSNPKVKGSTTEPDWKDHTGYAYRGQPVSQRDISRLLHYERTVKKIVDKAEAESKTPSK
eukprot:jgi/Botrbrau1/14864/Bobra.0326s0010.1